MIKLSEAFKVHDVFKDINYSCYSPYSILSIEKAAALSLKMNPEKAIPLIDFVNILWERKKGHHSEELMIISAIIKRRDEIKTAHKAGVFWHSHILLSIFVQWAIQKQYDIAEELIAICPQVIRQDWEAMYLEKCKELEKEKQDNAQLKTEIAQLRDQMHIVKENPSATTLKLDTKNKIIGALARGGYRYAPNTPNGAMASILEDLEAV